MTLGEMRRRMSGEEFTDWIRYYNAEPFGAPREEQKHGDLLSSLWILEAGKRAPQGYTSSSHWQYKAGPAEEYFEDPEDEAAAALAKLGG